MTAVPAITCLSRLTTEQVAAATGLVARATDVDGLRPLSEHVWLHLKSGGDSRSLHLLAHSDDIGLVGYAHLDLTDEVAGPSAELAVDPAHRRHGVGRALITELIAQAGARGLRLWAHGEQPGAAELARDLGFEHSRVLWQMRRSLFAPLPRAEVPAGVDIRPFRPGIDDHAWLELNARAFAGLPDQARWTQADLDRRLREQWFSAPGFLLAWRGEHLVGCHWTKVHGGERGAHHHESIGEVYVVCVDPDEAGTGLGRALTLLGLQHLRSLDLPQAMLYVDAQNDRAVRLYQGLGFARWDTDVEFTRG